MDTSRRTIALVATCLLCLVLAGLARSAPEDDIALIKRNGPRIAEIIARVGNPEGYVDQSVHEEFWGLLPKSVRDNPGRWFETLDVVRSMTYQKELWESVRLSARAGGVVKTLSYESALEKAFEDAALRADASRRADQMLLAASTGTPFRGKKGTVLLTEDMADQVLDGLNDSATRLRLLTDPVWRGTAAAGLAPSDPDHVDDSEIGVIAFEMNKRLPRDVGNRTRLDRISPGPGRRLTFNFTLTNRTANDVTAENIAAGRGAMVSLACTSEAVKSFLRDGIAVKYAYRTSDGASFTAIDVTPRLCAPGGP